MSEKKTSVYEILDCIAAKGKLRQLVPHDTIAIDQGAKTITFGRSYRNRVDIQRHFEGQGFARDQNFRGEWREHKVGDVPLLVGFLGRKLPPIGDDDDDDMDIFVAVGTPPDGD